MELGARLQELLGADTPTLAPGTLETLEALDALLIRWGKAVGLAGFKTGEERHRRYFAEALAALAWLPTKGRALDIGSGGGSPALPLAIARPSVAWTLVESNGRRATFLDEAVRALELENVRVARERYEAFVPEAPVDTVTLRGIAATEVVLAKAASEVRPGGRLLWFSSLARLSEARSRLGERWVVGEDPARLVPQGGFLLVATKRG